MKQYTDIMEIPVINGDAIVVLNGQATHIMKNDSLIITYKINMSWWLRKLIKNVTIERTSDIDGTRELSSLRNASVE